jgi:tetratricopeptide (TPR) repeat protein
LKLVAGLTGLGLDALVQRDAQRNFRRVMAVTLVAGAALLVVATLLVMAVRAGAEAKRQRAEAEGLVEYMLTDLRDKLKGVGRLDVMAEVNNRAMGYYRAQGDPAALSDDSLERRARVISAMADYDYRLGNAVLARQKYQALHATTRALLEKSPKSQNRMLDHARSENRLALFEGENGNMLAAIPHFENASRLLQQSEPQFGKHPNWLQLASLVDGNLCVVWLKQSADAAKAAPFCHRAVETGTSLVATTRSNEPAIHALVFHHVWLSEVQRQLGKSVAAESSRVMALSLIDQLAVTDPKNMLWKEQMLEVSIKFARVYGEMGNRIKAVDLLEKAKPVEARLRAADQSNAYWAKLSKKYSDLKKELSDNE